MSTTSVPDAAAAPTKATGHAADGYEIREVKTLDECMRLTEALWLAGYNPYHPVFSALHPVSGPTPADRRASIVADSERKWAQHKANPASTWIYVLEQSTGAVVAGAEWLMFPANPFPAGPQPIPCTWFPAGSDAAVYVSELLSQVFLPRMAWMQRPHAGLNSMGVVPGHRRRGVASLMMRWGHARVDERGLECFIEAHALGRWLYEEFGYRRLIDVKPNMLRKDPSDEWKRLLSDMEPPTVSLLYRPAYGDWERSAPFPWATRSA